MLQWALLHNKLTVDLKMAVIIEKRNLSRHVFKELKILCNLMLGIYILSIKSLSLHGTFQNI